MVGECIREAVRTLRQIDDCRNLLRQRDVVFALHITNPRHHLLEQPENLIGIRIGLIDVHRRPIGHDQRVVFVPRPKLPPQLLRDEGHKRMEQLDHLLVDLDGESNFLLVRLFAESRLDQLEIPIAVIFPEKLIDVPESLVQPIALERRFHLADRGVETVQNPALNQLKVLERTATPVIAAVLHKLTKYVEGIPDLIREVAAHFELRRIELDVLSLRAQDRQGKTDGVGAVLADHVERIDAVAEALRHPPAEFILDHPRNEDVAVRLLAHAIVAGHNHPRNPEKEDVIARDENLPRVEVLQVFRFLRPS